MNSKKYLETIKVENGEVFHLAFHQERLNEAIGSSKVILKEIILPPAEGLFRCRVVYDELSFSVNYFPYQKRDIRTLKLVYDDTIAYEKKYYDRSRIEHLTMQKKLCDDILIVKEGLITDTSIANVVFKYKNNWITPKKPLLKGTTRRRYIQNKKIFEEDIGVKDLAKFQKVGLLNAMIDFDIIRNDNIKEIIC